MMMSLNMLMMERNFADYDYDNQVKCDYDYDNYEMIIWEQFLKKIRDYLGVFPNRGRGGLLNPKTFVI